MLAYQGALLTMSAAQDIVTATETDLSWDTETHDTNDFYNPTYPTQFVIPIGLAGMYHMYSSVQWETNATGIRWIGIYAGGYERIRTTSTTIGTSPFSQYVGTTFQVEEGDIIKVVVYQTRGANLEVERSLYTPRFGIDFMGQSDEEAVV